LSSVFVVMGLSVGFVGCQGGTGLIGDALHDRSGADPVDEPATDNWQQALLSTETAMQQAATRLADALTLEAEAAAAEARGDAQAAADARARAEVARQEAEALQATAQQELAQVQAHLASVQAETEQLQAQINQIQNEQDPLSIQLRAKLTEKQQVADQIQSAVTRIEQVRVQIALYTEALRLKQKPLQGYGYAGGFSKSGGLPQQLTAHGWYYNWDFTEALVESDPRYVPMLWGGPSCASATTKNCTDEQTQEWVERYVGRLREDIRYRGRNWLVWNEPDDWHQAHLDAATAAKVWNVLYASVKAVDPTTRLYCCGTHPGWEARQNTNPNWMADFLAKIDADKAPDGIHYHNYSCFPDPADSTRATCGDGTLFEPSFNLEVMDKMERFVQSQPLIRGKDIVITEWAGLAAEAEHQCGGVNNRRLMRGVASFLSTWGKYMPGHRAAAWFITLDADGPAGSGEFYGSQLVHTDESALTCLGQEYETYRWGSVPAPDTQSLYAAHQSDTNICGARLDIAIPGKNRPADWRAHLIAYDWTGARIGPIQNYDAAPANGVHCGTYFAGNDQWPDTWYRVRGTKAELRARGLPRRVRVRLEIPGAAPSDFAPSVDLGP
jgi:hypothetical protein